MAGLIDDEVLNTFAVVGAHRRRWPASCSSGSADVVDRFNFYAPYPMEPERWAEVLAGFK